MIVCGWCGKPTPEPLRTCAACKHVDPTRPWVQRGEEVPALPVLEGRPSLTDDEMRRRLGALGPTATTEQIAEHFEVDPRTVRRWRQKVSA